MDDEVAPAPAGPSPIPEVQPDDKASPSPDANQEVEDTEEAEEAEEGKDKQEAAEGKKEKKKKKRELEPPKPKMDKTMGYVKHEDLDWIWIGGADDARDAVALKKHNVRYVLNCTPPRNEAGVSNFHEKDPFFVYERLSMGDNSTEQLETRIERAWKFLEMARIREDGGVLVHCQQGVSRSCSMVIAYLMKYYRYKFEDARTLTRQSRSQANPNEGFTKQLKDLEEKLIATNGYEKVPPKRKKCAGAGSASPGVGPARPGVGPSRGPVGPARPGVGPAAGPAAGPGVGPARGPVGPARGPARGPVGPQKGPAGPPPGPAVGPSAGPKPEKRKASGPAVGPARPEVGPSKPKKAKSDAVDLT